MALYMDYAQVNLLKQAITEAHDALSGPDGSPIPFAARQHEVGDGAAFGNTSGAAGCHQSWQSAAGAAELAASRLASALGADADRLGQVIQTFMTTDHQSADQLNSSGADSITFLSGHVHSGDSATDDYLRAAQVNRLAEHAAGTTGAVVVGLDANVSTIPAEQSDTDVYGPKAVSGFGGPDFSDVGDVANNQAGEGTHHGNSIDYVFSRGVTAVGDPDRIDGASSDHDGQAVDHRHVGW